MVLGCLNSAPLIPDFRSIIQKGTLRLLVVNHFVIGLVNVHCVSKFSVLGHRVDLPIYEIVHTHLVSMEIGFGFRPLTFPALLLVETPSPFRNVNGL